MARSSTAALGLVLAPLAIAGCGGPVDEPDAGTDAHPRIVFGVANVDLLFLIDNSNSMGEEQASLIAEVPRLVRVLASGDRDEDGVADFAPVRSLHVGIVTSDMGAGPYDGVPTCRRGLGDDGILQSDSRILTPPCTSRRPSGVFEFGRDTDDPGAFAAEVSCVANLGTGGCGFEQQLEASLKAITPISAQAWMRAGYSPPRFVGADGAADSVGGNADGPNLGFVRPASILAVVLVTDEEDCSVRDYGLFASGDPRFVAVPLNLRCTRFGDPSMGIVHPVQRYVDGFIGLRRDPSLLVFAAIVGIPPETEAPVGALPDFAAILAHPDMEVRANAAGTNLEPSCSNASGVAYAPTRIVETARGLSAAGAGVTLSSICGTDFEPAVSSVIDRIALRLGPS